MLLTIRWGRGQDEPWILISDELRDGAAVRGYRRRMRVEATYDDGKKRGGTLKPAR